MEIKNTKEREKREQSQITERAEFDAPETLEGIEKAGENQ